jgi:hypothetical protein
MMATRKGLVKKTPLEAYSRPKTRRHHRHQAARRMTNWSTWWSPSRATKWCWPPPAAWRSASTNPTPGRWDATPAGVKGINLQGDDEVVGMVVADPDATLLTVCENGYGKRTPFGPTRMGFDGVELLHIQMESEEPAYLQRLKQRALVNGLDLCGFSTHQGFVSPDLEVRQANIDKTIRHIELAYQLGIPTIRVNTGRWGTTKSFDELMANRGIEPMLPGYSEDDAFGWVIEAFEKCLPAAEKCGVTLGLENHWGLGLTPAGVLRIVNAIRSPWLQCTLDTGNFQLAAMQRIAGLRLPTSKNNVPPATSHAPPALCVSGSPCLCVSVRAPQRGRTLTEPRGHRGGLVLTRRER